MRRADRQPDFVRLRVLGGFDLLSGNGPAVPPLGRKARGLFVCLALSPGKAWPRERLMAMLWGDRSEDQARGSLRQALAEIRRAIGPQIIRANGDIVSLDPDLIFVDAVEFGRLAKAGRWNEAALLYQGPLFEGREPHEGAFEEWLRVERTLLQEIAIKVFEQTAMSRTGEAAIASAQRLLSLDPLREATHRLLMQIYADTGQRSKALRQYEQCREVLRRDLQAKPDVETDRLYHQIQNGAVSNSAAVGATEGRSHFPEERQMIAVLPFTNTNGDSTQDHFSNGVTEDIATELSRYRFLLVVTGVDKSPDAREVGLRLGARYLVEGQVRRAGARVRVTVRLIDTSSGNHLWAERFDRPFDDLFIVQDEITRMIVENVVTRVEADILHVARRKPPRNMRAYDYCLRAKVLFQWPRDEADVRQGREFCDRAIAIDPSYARAHAQKAFSYTVGLLMMEPEDLDEWRRLALDCAERAVLLDPMDAICHWALAEAAFISSQNERALEHITRAVAINPNDTEALAVSGYLHAFTGHAEHGLRLIDQALDRTPTHPSWYHWVRADILYICGQFEEASRTFKLHGPANPDTLLWHAATLVELGRIEDAHAEIQALLAIRPAATIDEFRRHHYFVPGLERFLENLRRAGLPEA